MGEKRNTHKLLVRKSGKKPLIKPTMKSMIKLSRVLGKWVVRMRGGSNWLRIMPSGGLWC
jgi:hypothetical protein